MWFLKERKRISRGEKIPFVIVSPAYNNRFFQNNLLATLAQDYENFSVIYIDDASLDGSFDQAKALVDLHPRGDKVQLWKNKKNLGMIHNYYLAIHTLPKDAVVVALDGDDWLAHHLVLQKLQEIYTQEDVVLTYGQYAEYPTYHLGQCRAIDWKVVKKLGGIRKAPWVTSHLRTFKASLFQSIPPSEFQYQNAFVKVTGDMAMMFSLLERAGRKSRFVDEILCLYNGLYPMNDHFCKPKEQKEMEHYFRSKCNADSGSKK